MKVQLLAAACAIGLAACATMEETVMAKGNPALGMVRHVVLMKFKDDTTPQKLAELEKHFAALADTVPSIVDFEWGTDMSTENLQQGFTHCFIVTFRDAAGRDAYLPDPMHQAFVKNVGPHLEKVLVVDYVVKN